MGPNPGPQQVSNLRNDELRNNQRTRMRLEQFQTLRMISVILVDVCVQMPSVYKERYRRASRLRISSIRRAVDLWPLRPAFAAISRRPLPPR